MLGLVISLAGCAERGEEPVEAPQAAAPPTQPAAPDFDALFDSTTLDTLVEGADADTAQAFRARLEATDPNGDPNGTLSTLDTLDAEVDAVFQADTPIRGELLAQRAYAEFILGRFDAADANLDEALPYFATMDLQRSSPYLDILGLKANVLAQTGQPEAGLEILKSARETRIGAQGERAPKVGQDNLNIAAALYRMGRYDESLEWIDKAVAVSALHVDPGAPQSVENHVTNLSSLSAIATTAGQTDRALHAAREAALLARESLADDSPTLGLALSNYGYALNGAARYAEAEDMLRSAVEARRKQLGDTHYRVATTLSNLASAITYQGRHAEAEAVYMQAFAILDALGEEQLAYSGMILDNAAKAAADQGNHSLAETRFRDAIDRLTRALSAEHGRVGLARMTLAETQLALGNVESALANIDTALPVIADAYEEDTGYPTKARTVRALVLSSSDPDAALADARAELDTIRRGLTERRFDAGRLSEAAQGAEMPLSQIATVAARARDANTLFDALQLHTLSDMSESDHRTAMRTVLSDPDVRSRIETLRQARERRLSAETALSEALAKNDVAAAQERRAEIDRLREEIATMDAALPAPGGDGRTALSLVGLAEAQAALEPSEALLVVTVAGGPKAMLLRPRDVLWRAADTTSARAVAEARSAIRDTLAGAEPMTAAHPGLDTLADVLGPEIGRALAGVEMLYIVQSGFLPDLPPSLLRDPAEPSRFLGERVAITQLPGVASLLTPPLGRDGPGGRYLGVGDPVLGEDESAPGADSQPLSAAAAAGVYLRSGSVEPTALKTLPRLPHTRDEIQAIAATFPRGRRTVLLGEAATEARLRRSALGEASVITFATHGLLPGETDGNREAALVLTPPETPADPEDDGLLMASEISQLSLDQPLVFLSACNTAGAGRSGRAFSGLPEAFFAAGARGVVASHWPVRDDAAALLSARTIALTSEGVPVAEALRRAQKELRESDLRGADHPAVWAPFAVIGR